MLKHIKKYSYPLYLVALGFLLIHLAFTYPEGKNLNRIWSDSEGYYMYLPAVFIYHTFEKDSLPSLSHKEDLPYPGTNLILNRYTYGVALLETPFFLLTHLFASLDWFGSSAPTGFSGSYSDALIYSGVFYAMLGLWFLFKALGQIFSTWTAFFTSQLIFLGTNAFYYTVGEPGTSHIFSFFLCAWLVYLTPQWYTKSTVWNSLALGFVAGMIVLIRPTNIIVLLYPLFYQVYRLQDLRGRINALFQRLAYLAWALLPVILVALPQMYYWYFVTGKWIVFSYGEGNFFPYLTHPKMFRVLLDVQNGLLIYSPIIWISILGMVITSYLNLHSGPVITFIFLLATYLFGSWLFWWFGGAFGHRCYVELYPLLAIPMAYIFSHFSAIRLGFRWIGYLAALCMTYYNLRLTYLYRGPWDGPGWNWDRFDDILQAVWVWPF